MQGDVKIVLLSRDLMFISRVRETALASGLQATVAKSEEAFLEATAGGDAGTRGVVLFDLEKCPVSMDVLQRCLTSTNRDTWRCLGFYSHLNVALAEQARGIGLEEVLPRSKFVQILPALCSSLASTDQV